MKEFVPEPAVRGDGSLPALAPSAGGPAAWDGGKCCVPMWMSGSPSGLCGEPANGPQYPKLYLERALSRYDAPYCFGPCCPKHGGPKDGQPIIFQDGNTDEGRPMWCAVLPGFVNLQESPAGFSGDPLEAVANLRLAATNPEATSLSGGATCASAKANSGITS